MAVMRLISDVARLIFGCHGQCVIRQRGSRKKKVIFAEENRKYNSNGRDEKR